MSGRRFLSTLVVAVVLLVATPAAASAASRYAAPTAQGSGDCLSPANACPIATAVGGASNGDNIFVLANLGSYNLGSGNVDPGAAITLHFYGLNGQARLISTTSSYVVELKAPSSTAVGLYLEDDASNGGAMYVKPASGTISVDRVFAKVTGSSHACYLGGGVTLTNSVCWQSNPAASDLAIETDGANTLRNDVAWVNGGGVGIRCFGRSGVTGDDTLINTIVRVTGAGGHDLAARSGTSETATFDVSYSNFGTTLAEGTAGLDHFNTDATDQSAAPALVNPGTGDFHELSISPTINAGITSSANGTLDLDGNPRTVNGKTDIGPYEVGTPGTTPPKLTPPHNTRISKAKLKKKKHTASFSFTAAGTVTGFQCALVKPKKTGKHHKKPKLSFSSCSSPKTLKHLKHLKHGHYTFEVQAFNSAGVDPTPAIKKFKL